MPGLSSRASASRSKTPSDDVPERPIPTLRARRRAVPPREGGARRACAWRHRPQGGELHVCMLCARECPDWCIYIEAPQGAAPPRREGGKPRTVNALDRFDIDFSLCMYCGICVEVCPFEALFWSARVRVLRAQHRRPAPRQGAAWASGCRRCPSFEPLRGRRRRSRRCRSERRCSPRAPTTPSLRTSPSGSSPS